MKNRAVPILHIAMIAEAATLLEHELDPIRLQAASATVREAMPSLADDLARKASRALQIRSLFTRALAGELFDD